MDEPKLPLEYFARLIDFGGLHEKRESIREQCALSAMGQGAQITHDEIVVYDDYVSSLASKFPFYDAGFESSGDRKPGFARPPMHLFKPAHSTTRDLKKEICAEIKQQASKSMAKLYEQLSTGTQVEQELVYKQALRDLDRWAGIIANDSLYGKYSCIADALRGIRAYLESYHPLSKEEIATDAPTQKIEPVVGFLYQCLEAGAKPDRIKAITQRHLDNLYSTLKDDLKFIAPETTLENFRTVFSGKIVSVPIRWLGTNAQLRYLIKSIESKLIQPGDNKVHQKWEITAACFVNRKGEVFTSSQIESTGTGKRGVPMALEIEAAAKKLK